MKNVIQIVLSRKEVEEAVRDYITTHIPEAATVSVRSDGKWYEFPTYSTNDDCVKIEFTKEDIEKEIEEAEKKRNEGGEQDWTANDEMEKPFL